MADRKNQKQKRQEVTEAFWKNDIKKAEELSKRKFLPFEEILRRAGLSDKVRVTSGARTRPMGSAGNRSNHLKRDEYGDSRAFDLVSLVPNKSVYDLLYENPMTRDYLSFRNARYIDERTPAALARTKGTGAHEHISLSDGIGLREGRAFIPAGVQSTRASFNAAMQTPQFDILQKVITPDFLSTLPTTLPTPSNPQAPISEEQTLMPSITLDEVEVIGNRPQTHPLDIITPRTWENIVEDRRGTTPAVNTVAQVQGDLLDMRQKELEDNLLYPSSSSYSFLDDEERQRRMRRDIEDLQFERQMNEALKPLLNKAACGGKLFDGGGPMEDEIAFQKWRATLPSNLQEDTIHYDLRGAYKAGLTPEWNETDKSYHLGSRDPRTGRILKKPSHPTFLVALVADAAEGYWPSKIDKDGTFYTEEDKRRGKLFGNVFNEGGPTEDPSFESDKILGRANKVYTNYDKALDFNMNPLVYGVRNFLYKNGQRSGLSNCTLTASQWVDPNTPIKSAASIVDNPSKYGYEAISAKDALPGNLMISRNPQTGGYHTMLIESINPDGTPNLRYSTGGPHNDSMRYGVSQADYHDRDSKQGGMHTEDLFFRKLFPNEYYLPEVTITPNKN